MALRLRVHSSKMLSEEEQASLYEAIASKRGSLYRLGQLGGQNVLVSQSECLISDKLTD